MNPPWVVVDANIAFKAITSGRGELRTRFKPGAVVRFAAPKFLFVELFKHKDRLVRARGKSEEQLIEALHTLVSALEFKEENRIPIGTWAEAYRLCAPTDAKDTPYVALALHLDGFLWTEDKALKDGLRKRGFDRFFGSDGA